MVKGSHGVSVEGYSNRTQPFITHARSRRHHEV